jgi:hypothetical protein
VEISGSRPTSTNSAVATPNEHSNRMFSITPGR